MLIMAYYKLMWRLAVRNLYKAEDALAKCDISEYKRFYDAACDADEKARKAWREYKEVLDLVQVK